MSKISLYLPRIRMYNVLCILFELFVLSSSIFLPIAKKNQKIANRLVSKLRTKKWEYDEDRLNRGFQ